MVLLFPTLMLLEMRHVNKQMNAFTPPQWLLTLPAPLVYLPQGKIFEKKTFVSDFHEKLH